MFEFATQGTCSTKIRFSIVDGKVKDLSFERGCNGNLKSIARLVEGRGAEEVIEALDGIDCGGRGTSCGDQLAKALKKALREASRQNLDAKLV